MNCYSIKVKREYLDKSVCREEARRIIREGHIKGMSEGQLAREIFFHALIYYACGDRRMFRRLKEHADPIDLTDGGDTMFRKAAFAASWMIPAALIGKIHRKGKDNK